MPDTAEEDVRDKLNIYFDGSTGPQNPGGTAAYGFIVKDSEGNVIHSASGRVGDGMEMTNNVAEFAGLLQAMRWVEGSYPEAQVTFYGDSTLVISLMRGEAKAHGGKYIPWYEQAIVLATPYIFKNLWHFQWIQRALNSEADELSQYYRFSENKP